MAVECAASALDGHAGVSRATARSDGGEQDGGHVPCGRPRDRIGSSQDSFSWNGWWSAARPFSNTVERRLVGYWDVGISRISHALGHSVPGSCS